MASVSVNSNSTVLCIVQNIITDIFVIFASCYLHLCSDDYDDDNDDDDDGVHADGKDLASPSHARS